MAARHASVAPGTYLFDRVLPIHESHLEVQGLIGQKILVFRRQGSVQKVYLYANPTNLIPLQDAIAVCVPDFLEICAGLMRSVTTLEVKSTMFLWGAQPLVMEAISPSYRHLFRVPLESFEEMSEQARREEARRRAEADAREAAQRAAQADKARRDAAAKAQQQAAPARPRPASQARPVPPAPRRTATPTRFASRPMHSDTRYHDDDDSLADFMFMSMFPDVAPMYRPNSFMAWYLWSQNQHDHHQDQVAGAGGTFDGGGASGNWEQGVPGFPDAASQRVSEYAGIKRVDLLDESGRNVGSFTVTENNGQTQFQAPGGHVFTVANPASPTIEYTSEAGQRFSWDGTNEPVVGAAQDSEPTVAAAVQSFFDAGDSRDSSADSPSTRDVPQGMESNTAY